MIRPGCGGRTAIRARKVPSSVRLPPPPLPSVKDPTRTDDSMKMPVGPLGLTDEERAELIRTGKWPERVIEVPDKPPGFGLNGLYIPSPKLPDLSAAKESAAAIRDLWRFEGRLEGREEGLREARERLLSALDAPTPETTKPEQKTPSRRRRGRPAGQPRIAVTDAKAMNEIRERNPGRDFVHLFKQSLRRDYPTMLQSSITRRTRDAKALLKQWDTSKK